LEGDKVYRSYSLKGVHGRHCDNRKNIWTSRQRKTTRKYTVQLDQIMGMKTATELISTTRNQPLWRGVTAKHYQQDIYNNNELILEMYYH
jgi:hypothetical protein